MDHNEQLGIRSVRQWQKDKWGAKLKENVGLVWMLETWYEKLIVMILIGMGCWKIWEFVFA